MERQPRPLPELELGEETGGKRVRRGRQESTILFDAQVSQLRLQGKTRSQIAQSLGRPKTTIVSSIGRLIAAGEIEKLRPDPRESKSRQQVEEILRQFRTDHPDQPVNFAEIARQIGLSRERVRRITNEIYAGQGQDALPARKIPLRGSEREDFDRQIAGLRRQRLTTPQIVHRLNHTPGRVKKALERLRRNGEQFPRPIRRWPDILQLMGQVKKLRERGLKNNEIVKILGCPKQRVEHAAHLLIKSGQIKSLRRK